MYEWLERVAGWLKSEGLRIKEESEALRIRIRIRESNLCIYDNIKNLI